MWSRILFLLCLVNGVWDASSMALNGPALTRYDPCSLGMIHFDRMRDNYWRGIVHFGLYTNMVEAVMVMEFKEAVTLYAVSIYFVMISIWYFCGALVFEYLLVFLLLLGLYSDFQFRNLGKIIK